MKFRHECLRLNDIHCIIQIKYICTLKPFMCQVVNNIIAQIWVQIYILDAPCEDMSPAICVQRKPRSACAFAQSDQGLHYPLTESLNTIECMNGGQRPGDILRMRTGMI